jgi:hypothetical protein
VALQFMRVHCIRCHDHDPPGWGKLYLRLRFLTVAELLLDKDVEMPPQHLTSLTFRRAPKVERSDVAQLGFVAETGA